jgi:hypothetical protein
MSLPILAAGSRAQLLSIAESTYGTTPGTPNMLRRRITGHSLEEMRGNLKSAELRPDRILADFREGIINIAGDVDFELIYQDFDDIIASALFGTWSDANAYGDGNPATVWASSKAVNAEAIGSTAGSVTPITHTLANVPVVPGSIVIADTVDELSLTDTDNGDGTGSFAATGVHSSYFTSGTVSYFTGNVSLIFTTSATGGSLVANYRQRMPQRQSFTFEAGYLDIGQYLSAPGCLIDTLSFDIKANAITKCKAGILGIGPMSPASTTIASGIIQPTTNNPMDSFTGTLKIGGSAVAYIMALTISLKNNLEKNEVIGSKQILGTTPGMIDVTGQVSAFFKDTTLLADFYNETAGSIDVTMNGIPTDKTLEIVMPAIKFTKGNSPVTGEKSVIVTLPYQAYLDPVTQTNIYFTRSNAAS